MIKKEKQKKNIQISCFVAEPVAMQIKVLADAQNRSVSNFIETKIINEVISNDK